MNLSWKNIPFAPKRCPFFYGWVIVAAATVTTVASVPGQTMGVGVFTDDLIVALGISRVQLSTAYMIGTICSSLMLPLAGRLIDSLGVRVMVVIAASGLGLSLVSLSNIERIIALSGSRSFFAIMSVTTVCFMLIRFFGQGSLTMVSRVAIGKWFNHRRGLATGISAIFVTFGFNASPQFLNSLNAAYGWREACLVLALTVGLGVSIPAWILFRDNPESCGLVMDGIDDPAWLARMSAKVADTKREFTRSEAIRTPAFWLVSGGLATQALIITAVTFHIVSLGAGAALDRSQVYNLFIPMSFFGIVGSLFGGWISDLIKLKWLLISQLVFQAIGTFGLLDLGNPLGQWAYIVGYGVSGGFFATLITVAWPRFFGREHLGAITGLSMSILVFASAVGPVLFSLSQLFFGTYLCMILICGFMPLLLSLASIKADNPQEKLSCDNHGIFES